MGQSKGYGFVQFDNEESAQHAIDKLNGMLINDKQVYVGHFLRKQERETTTNKTKFNNVYVKNLSESMTDKELKTIFGDYGEITSAVVMRDADGKSKCFGFVNFENTDAAAKVVDALNGKKFEEKEWYVGKAQKKAEREHELKSRFEQTVKEAADKLQGVNLYVKNLDDSIDDEKLTELFSEFGNITSCKVMHDPNGISKGSGFVAFSTPDEASRSLAEMNHKLVVGKPLYVVLVQRQEERRARLQGKFSQMGPLGIPSVSPCMPMYPSGAPSLGHHYLYGQAPPAIIPPQAGFGYQQQIVPGMGPRGPLVPNFFVPAVQHGQRPWGRQYVGPVPQTQQPIPLMQQPMLGRGSRYRPGSNMPKIPISSVGAAKVTGMLLEMDQTEVLHLIESPEALKAKVAEAMEMLRSVSTQEPKLTYANIHISVCDIVSPTYVSMGVQLFFDHHRVINYGSILVKELVDVVFIVCSMNHGFGSWPSS
ncbi:Polyadenylate-binding protein 4 [Hibiscus syriacus]|uniref:Polyadenylate-binding protein 4 n=1 Tax=Hibiscus syriacus TaxID=106335 RepID=A0A6A2ZX18_HIBSY|nr:Polyadenylate-binding protein 4 [Hibiscus syriacus]